MEASESSRPRAVIETDGKAIDVNELSSFLYYFRAAYVAAHDLIPADLRYRALKPESAYELANYVRDHLTGLDLFAVARLSHAKLQDDNLGIIDISRENPLTIVFEAAIAVFTVAVVLSGGRFKLGPLDVRLPPLGTGIKSLRAAFGKTPRKIATKRKATPKKREPPI